jgi:rhodanese-related sulfurtransferase
MRLTPGELRDLGEHQLIDVRRDEEWQESRLPGARHIPLDRLQGEIETIDRDRPIVFYCKVGERSAMAAQAFEGAGYDASDLEGGIIAWQEAGFPTE